MGLDTLNSCGYPQGVGTKQRQRASFSGMAGKRKLDPVKQYAEKVISGQYIAGPHVRDTCKRHMRDLRNQKKHKIRWDLPDALYAIEYFQEVLHLAGGEFEGKPFNPLPWEQFIIGSLFGWKDAKDGYRRFRVAYVETGKGSGKTPLLAGIGLYMLTSDDEARAEVYAAATKRDQAVILFRDAVAMVGQSPDLDQNQGGILKIHGSVGQEWNLSYPDTNSFFRPISSEDRGIGQSGARPHCGLLDEIHEHSTNAMVEFMRAGTKQRTQALILMITNSGFDKTSVCYGYHDYGAKVAGNEINDNSFFSYICSLDEKDDPFKSERCWKKVNPSLPTTPGIKYLREQVREAKGMPSKESIVRRLNFCEWVDAEDPWISKDSWLACVAPINFPDPESSCVGAVDLSGKLDLTALTVEFKLKDGRKLAFTWYWTPKATLKERQERDRVPYTRWVKDGYMIAVDGKSIKFTAVALKIKEIAEQFNLKMVAYDRWRITDLIDAMDEEGTECYLAKVVVGEDGKETVEPEDQYVKSGIAMIPHGQGFKDMAPAVDDLEQDIVDENITIQENPVTTMCASNAVLQADAAGNRKFAKQKSTGRIDGIITLCMANRVSRLDVPVAAYDKRGMQFF